MAASLPDHMQLANTESLAPKGGKVTLKSNFDRALAFFYITNFDIAKNVSFLSNFIILCSVRFFL
jgi:hypothetical protein